MTLIPVETIESKIFLIRGRKVMLDSDLSVLYGVETRALNQAVRRNIERFPGEFMFQLTKTEAKSLRSQIVTLKKGKRSHYKYMPYAFTEPGVAMLSSVLNSNRAIQVNIQIIKTFIKLREIALTHVALKRKIEAMERNYDRQFKAVFEAIRKLLEPPPARKRKIGFLA